MPKILFFVPETYAYNIFFPIEESAREYGYEIAWYASGCTTRPVESAETVFTSFADAKFWSPDVVVSCTHWVPPALPGFKVMVFHGFAINKRGVSPDANGHFRIRGYYDLYCTMAEFDTSRYLKLAKKHRNFLVLETGWPKLDPLFNVRDTCYRKSISAESKNSRTLFYASTFSPNITSAPHVVGALKELRDSGRWQIYATLHPKMSDSVIKRYRTLDDGDCFRFIEPGEDLLPWMAQADVALTDSSSIIFELLFLDVPVVTYKTTMPGPHLIDVTDPKIIEEALNQAAERPKWLMEAIKAERVKMHKSTDGRASERVMEAIQSMLSGELKPAKKRKGPNILRRISVQKELSEREFS